MRGVCPIIYCVMSNQARTNPYERVDKFTFSDSDGEYNINERGYLEYTHKDGEVIQAPLKDMVRSYIEFMRKETWVDTRTGEKVSNTDLPRI